ncbi:ricin-type beta-trefoil lectin domain protein [Dactylosporangium sp. NPDC000521]|uniref:ricin-type beta-trefoil lectin domain protein n=1 Tax=Dactylosporangium sp. NPDC000521 TaxID=3363975 RepID=UPI0036A08CC6
MTDPGMTNGMVEPELDGEPLLVRPYVRLLADQHAEPTAEEPLTEVPLGGEPASAGRPEDDGRPATTPTDVRLTRARPVGHVRRRYLAIGSGMLVLVLCATALGLGLGDRPAAPAAGPAGMAAPRGGLLGTAAVPAPPASDAPATAGASTTQAMAGASAVAGTSSAPGVSAGPADAVPTTGAPELNGQPAVSPTPAGESRTGRITGASGLCLDGTADRDDGGDRVRRSDCNGTSGQAWTVAQDGTVQALGRCLQAAGDQPRLRSCDGGPVQRWRSGPAGSLINQASGLCLGSSDNGNGRPPLRMAACDRSDAQRWTLP